MNPWTLLGGLLLLIAVAAGSYLEGHSHGVDAQTVKDNTTIAGLKSTISTMQHDAAQAALKHDADVAAAEQEGAANVAKTTANTNQAVKDQHDTDQKTIDCMRRGGCGLRISKPAGCGTAGRSPVPGTQPTAPGSDGAGTVALDGGTSADLDTYAVDDVNKIIGNLTKLQDYASQAQVLCNGH
jgi:hypothetical protein